MASLLLRRVPRFTLWHSVFFRRRRIVCKNNSVGSDFNFSSTISRFDRVDGLSKREESAAEMTEHFVNRDDFLYYRNVKFGVRQKKVQPATNEAHPRPILVSVVQLAKHDTDTMTY